METASLLASETPNKALQLTFYRLPGRALGPPANGERDRVARLDGAPAPAGHPGSGLAPEGSADGLRARRHGGAPLATSQCSASGAAGARGVRFLDGMEAELDPPQAQRRINLASGCFRDRPFS